MNRFRDLYTIVESIAHDEQERLAATTSFLLCAESRYVRYLSLLKEFAKGLSKVQDGRIQNQAIAFSEIMPLPPWYYEAVSFN